MAFGRMKTLPRTSIHNEGFIFSTAQVLQSQILKTSFKEDNQKYLKQIKWKREKTAWVCNRFLFINIIKSS